MQLLVCGSKVDFNNWDKLEAILPTIGGVECGCIMIYDILHRV